MVIKKEKTVHRESDEKCSSSKKKAHTNTQKKERLKRDVRVSASKLLRERKR
jgi:hypothetical protein